MSFPFRGRLRFTLRREWKRTVVAARKGQKRLGSIDHGQRREPVRDELFQRRDILEETLEDKIEAAGHVMIGDDLRKAVQGSQKRPDRIFLMARKRDRDVHAKSQSQLFGIEQCTIARDDSALLQFAHPVEHSRRSQADLPGQVRVGNSAVGLQGGQEFAVYAVEIEHHNKNTSKTRVINTYFFAVLCNLLNNIKLQMVGSLEYVSVLLPGGRCTHVAAST